MPQALFAPPVARVLHVGVATGLFAHLARNGPRPPEALAADLNLQPAGTRLLCECLVSMGHLRFRRDGRVGLSRRSRRWLDPDSPRSVLRYVEHTATYWSWWEQLEGLVRDGTHVELHDAANDDASWDTYIRGQHELARLSAPEVARALDLPPGARSVLDLGGAHGWFSAVLCDRHPGLQATVVDLPGSAAVGRAILEESGHADRVDHLDGSVFQAELGEGHDLALVFNLVHHLRPRETVALLRRVHGALRPGGRVAVLDLFAREHGEKPGGEAFLGLFFHLTSGADLPRESELRDQLAEAGFDAPTSTGITRLPAQTLYVAARS